MLGCKFDDEQSNISTFLMHSVCLRTEAAPFNFSLLLCVSLPVSFTTSVSHTFFPSAWAWSTSWFFFYLHLSFALYFSLSLCSSLSLLIVSSFFAISMALIQFSGAYIPHPKSRFVQVSVLRLECKGSLFRNLEAHHNCRKSIDWCQSLIKNVFFFNFIIICSC